MFCLMPYLCELMHATTNEQDTWFWRMFFNMDILEGALFAAVFLQRHIAILLQFLTAYNAAMVQFCMTVQWISILFFKVQCCTVPWSSFFRSVLHCSMDVDYFLEVQCCTVPWSIFFFRSVLHCSMDITGVLTAYNLLDIDA